MEHELKTAIDKLIAEHLPKATGDQLVKRLTLIDDLEKMVIEKDRIIEQKTNEITRLNLLVKTDNELAESRNVLASLKAKLDAQEADLKNREYQLELSLVKKELDYAKQNTLFAKDVAMGLVRNTEYRKQVFDSHMTQIPLLDQYNATRWETKTVTENKTEVEGNV